MAERQPFSQDVMSISYDGNIEHLGKSVDIDAASRTIHVKVASQEHTDKVRVNVGHRGVGQVIAPPMNR